MRLRTPPAILLHIMRLPRRNLVCAWIEVRAYCAVPGEDFQPIGLVVKTDAAIRLSGRDAR